jgi:hypothetical protein
MKGNINLISYDCYQQATEKQLAGLKWKENRVYYISEIHNEKMQDEIYLEDQKCYLDRVMTNDKENKMILCIMKDITKERKHKDQIHNAQIEAARMADKLVEEQLKIVQQIAGLLGETAADTKVAVEKLKNTILLESEEENEKK